MIRVVVRGPGAIVATVSTGIFADSLLYSAVIPVLPAYATEHGASPTAIGILFASYAVGLLAVTPLAGLIADRIGHRTPLVVGMLGVTAATVLFGVADSYPGLLLARTLQGAGAAVVWTCGTALVAGRVAPERAGTAMGVVLSSMSAGLLLGPPVAGFLVDAYGFRTPFLLLAAITAAVALVQSRLPATRPSTRPTRAVTLWRERSFRRTMLAVVAASAAMSLLEPLLPLDLEERFGSSSTVIGLVFGAATLAHLLASPPVGALADRVLRRPLIAGGLLGMAVTIGFAAGPPSPFGVAMVLVAFAVAYSFVLVPVLAEVAAVVRTLGGTAYAAAYGAFNIAYAVGMVVGTTAGSGAMTWLPLTDVLVASGVVLASVALLLAAPLCRAARPLLRPRTDPDPRTTTSEGAL